MRYVAVIVFTFMFSGVSVAAGFQPGQIYALHVTVSGLKKPDGTGSFTAARPSKFVILDDSDANNYLVRFVTVYSLKTGTEGAKNGETTISSTVRKDEAYYLPKNTMGQTSRS